MRIGIDIGGSHVGIGIIKGEKIINSSEKVLTKDEKKDIKNNIVKIIIEMLYELIDKSNVKLKDIEFIGIASPGTISDNKIIKATNLGIENFDLIGELQKNINLPMQIKNDSKCAALAEKNYGNMKKYDDCIFLTLGTGIGGAAFLNGEMLVPKRYSGFEFGHMIINKNGLKCSCGKKGCFETYASMRSFRKKIADAYGIENNFSGDELRSKLLDMTNPKVEKIVDEFTTNLTIGICNLIDIFEPEIIVLGGSFSHYEDTPLYKILVEKIADKKNRFNDGQMPKIAVAKLKNDAGMIGATIKI